MPAVLEEAARALGAPLKRIGAEYTYEVEDAASLSGRRSGGRRAIRRLALPAAAAGI